MYFDISCHSIVKRASRKVSLSSFSSSSQSVNDSHSQHRQYVRKQDINRLLNRDQHSLSNHYFNVFKKAGLHFTFCIAIFKKSNWFMFNCLINQPVVMWHILELNSCQEIWIYIYHSTLNTKLIYLLKSGIKRDLPLNNTIFIKK